jgi:uncharacterized membrane protein HdeD (DUF308 family)
MTAQPYQAEAMPKLTTGWEWLLAAGVLFVAVGVLAVFQPLLTSLAVGIYLGVSFLLVGAMAAAAGIVNIKRRGAWLYIVLGLLAMLAGAYMAYQPLAAAVSLVWAAGIWLIVAGAMELTTAFQMRKHRGWMILVGVVDVVLGGLLIFIDPVSALGILTIMVSVSFVMRGVASIVFALELRRLARI